MLISGTAGTGKTSIAAHFAAAACGRGEKCLYLSFEESANQLQRNLRSIGLDLSKWTDKELLQIHSSRPTNFGLEMHLAEIYKLVVDFEPSVVIVDPISNFISAGTSLEAGGMLLRMVDYLKSRSITSLFTNLVHNESVPLNVDSGISSIIDTWLLLRDIERNDERYSTIHVLKSRGMAHSNKFEVSI